MGEELMLKILTSLETMNERLHSLTDDISSLKASQRELENEVLAIKSSQTRFEESVAAINTSQVKLENDLAAKVDVLFDGWQQHEDYALRADQQLTSLETKLDKLLLRISKINALQEEHTELLNILTARSVSNETEILALKRAK